MARERIVLTTSKILGGKAGLLTGSTADVAKVQAKPRADRASAAKVVAKPTPPRS